jgi:hypothetical protein
MLEARLPTGRKTHIGDIPNGAPGPLASPRAGVRAAAVATSPPDRYPETRIPALLAQW